MTALTHEQITTAVVAAFPTVSDVRAGNGRPYLRVPPAAITDVARFLRDTATLACDGLMDLTAVDPLRFPSIPADAIVVVYLLFSYRHRHKVTLQVFADRNASEVPSVAAVWPAANYFEREVYDLFGVRFLGHPSLQRILLPDDWQGHPLRKDYTYPVEYRGVAHLRDGQSFSGGPTRTEGKP